MEKPLTMYMYAVNVFQNIQHLEHINVKSENTSGDPRIVLSAGKSL